MSRWKAFGIHLSLSALLLSILLIVIMWVWYPGILFSVDGGWTGLRIVIGVDLVLGPLLTLIVFKSGKPGLKFDLTAIAVFQLSCMAAGMWIVYSERPLALVLAHDTIYSIAAQEFEEYDQDPEVLRDFPGSYPKLVYTELPEGEIAADVAVLRSQFIGDPLYVQTERYRPIPAEDADTIFRRETAVRESVSEELRERLPENCLFAKFISVVTSGYVCFDPDNMRLDSFYENEYRRGEESASGDAEGNPEESPEQSPEDSVESEPEDSATAA